MPIGSTQNLIMVVISALCYICALMLHFASIKYRTEHYPASKQWNIRYWWTPIWRQRKYFKPVGYRMQVAFVVLVILGSCFLIAGLFLPQ